MATYKLLALDMDGTLLTSNKLISARTVEALRRAAEAGVTVALSTGRTTSELADYLPQLSGVVRYAALLSGGAVRDLETDEVLYCQRLSPDDVYTIMRQGLDEHAMVQLLTPDCAVMTRADVDRMPEVGQGVYQDLALRLGHLVDDISAYADDHGDNVCKVNLHHETSAARERSWHALESLPVQLVMGEAASIEITPLGVTKARGLEWLCHHLGIDLAETIVVGDSNNDLDALEVAGLAVAMGNSTPEVFARADATVADNDHDGIAEVVSRWLV